MLSLLCRLLSLITQPDREQQIQLLSTHEPALAAVNLAPVKIVAPVETYFIDIGGFPELPLRKPTRKTTDQMNVVDKSCWFYNGGEQM